VDNFVLRYYDQNGDRVLPVDPGTGATLPAFWPLGADERALVRSVEMELTLRTLNEDPRHTATFAVEDNTVASYDTAGDPQTSVPDVTDGYRRRTFTARVSPRNLSANVCGKITLNANPGSATCGTTSSLTAVVTNQFGDPVVTPVTFSLDPTSGATLSASPVTTNAAGEAQTTLSYPGLAQAIRVSATASVDCRPTGPQMYTLQNSVAVGYGPGYADRIELTTLPPASPAPPVTDTCGGATWTFEAAGFDLCGNPAAQDPALPFQFEAVNGTIADDQLDTPTKTFTVAVGGASGVTTSELWLSSVAGLGVPSEIQVEGVAQTAPYNTALHTINLRPWPPGGIVPDPATWLDVLYPATSTGPYQNCADLLVATSDPFVVQDCADNPVSEILAGGGFGYDLVPTLTGPGTLAVVDNGGAGRTLEYSLDGCGTPPGSSVTVQAGLDLRDPGGAVLDHAGPKDIPVEGCANYTVTVVKNPTPCDLTGTVEITGCDMTGKSIEVWLSTPTGGAVASFSPPLTPRQEWVPYTFPNNSPLQLDVYVTKATVGDAIEVTAYYPDKASSFFSESATLNVDTHCSNLQLFADDLFAFADRIETGGPISCLGQVQKLYARVQDCQSASISPNKEVTVYLFADGALYDRERIDLVTDPSDPDYLISDPSAPLNGALPVRLDDGFDVPGNNILSYPAGKAIRLVADYRDPADAETCSETVDGLTSPASVCFFNALASGGNADLPPGLEVHWGDVVVEGTADLQAAAPAVAKRASPIGNQDPSLDVYVGLDAAGTGGYYLTTSGDTSGGAFRPFLATDDRGNYFQGVSNIGIRTLAPDLEYDALRSFARAQVAQRAYWYALSGPSACPDGPELSDFAGTGTACLGDVLTTVTAPLLFIDTFGAAGSPPTATGATIDAAPLSGAGALPAWTIGNLFTGDIPHRVIYIAGSVAFTTTGGGASLAVDSPPAADVHYNDNPAGSNPWSPTEADLPIEFDTTTSRTTINVPGVNIRAGLYLDGSATFAGSPVIFGSLVAERGVEYTSGSPEIWYDYDLRGASTTTCSQCGTRPVTGCGMTAAPNSIPFQNPFGDQTVTVGGLLGLLSGSSDDTAVASFDLTGQTTARVEARDVGTTTVRLRDSLQPACAVAVPVTVGCSPGLSAALTALTFGPSNNFTTLLGNDPLTWTVASGNAVSLSGANPAPAIRVNAARVGSADVSGAFLGTSCAGSLGFTVGCGVTASIVSGTPPGNVLYPGGAGITLQAAYASDGVDRWEEASPGTPGLTVTSSGTTATVSLGAGATNASATTVDVYDVSGCQASPGVGLIVCPLEIDAGTASLYVGETLSLSVTGDSGSGAAWSCTSSGGGSVSLSTSTGVGTDLTGLAAGTVTCRAADATYGACTAETTVTVRDCPTALTPTAGSVRETDPPSLTLTATGFPGDVTWTQASGDGGSVSIDAGTAPFWTALVGGTADGTVTVTATDPNLPTCPATAAVTVTPACVDLAIPNPPDGATYGTDAASASMVWEGVPDDLEGGDPLDNIDRLYFRAINASGTETYSHSEGASGYCGFGSDNCSANPGDVSGWADGVHTLEVRAETKAGHPCGVTSITRSVQITIDNTP
jgi:hypothetical protein